jgi:hypothetical protein
MAMADIVQGDWWFRIQMDVPQDRLKHDVLW